MFQFACIDMEKAFPSVPRYCKLCMPNMYYIIITTRQIQDHWMRDFDGYDTELSELVRLSRVLGE